MANLKGSTFLDTPCIYKSLDVVSNKACSEIKLNYFVIKPNKLKNYISFIRRLLNVHKTHINCTVNSPL